MQRRLATILGADIVGYSSLREHAAERVARCQELVRDKVSALGGRDFPGPRPVAPGRHGTVDLTLPS